MWTEFQNVGVFVRNVVLFVANSLRQEAAPGLVTLALLLLLIGSAAVFSLSIRRRRLALAWMRKAIANAVDQASFSSSVDTLEAKLGKAGKSRERRHVLAAWQEYRETLVPHEENGAIIIRNSVRPSMFFNADDLGFSPGFWRIVPGLFVTVGLFLTFLGLIAALNSMDLSADKVNDSLKALMTVASAKFIMSLTGLFCSIVFTILLRVGTSSIEREVHDLCSTLETRLSFISLEALAVEQLAATREQREHFRMIGLELVAELGRPLREELPAAISYSISTAMAPLLDQVGRMGSDAMGSMVHDLSTRFSADVGQALASASESLSKAGDRIAQLSERMDQSSGRVGTEIDGAASRLTQAVDDLRAAMGATAETASGALTQGAEKLLSVMSQTLEGIRDNTGEGARALSAAATEMREAAQGFRAEIETASTKGSLAAREQIEAASAQAAGAIGSAGTTVRDAMTQGAERLLAVMNQTLEGIRDNTGEGARALSAAAAEMREAAQGFRSEIETASRMGANSAREQIDAAGAQAAGAVGTAGSSVLDAVGKAAREISDRTEKFTEKAAQQLLAPLDEITDQLKAMVASLSDGASGMRRLSDGVRAGAEASEQAAGSFKSASQDLVAAVGPVRSTTERIEAAVVQLKDSTETAASTVTRSAQATAQSAAQVLAAAQQTIGGHARAIEQSLQSVSVLVDRLKGQGDRLDVLDVKLGQAFETYNDRVAAAVETLFGHVKKMNDELSPALSTLQTIVEQAEQFMPQSRRA